MIDAERISGAKVITAVPVDSAEADPASLVSVMVTEIE